MHPWPVTLLWSCAFVFTVIEITNTTFGAMTLSFKQMWLPPLLFAGFLIVRRFSLTLALLPHLNTGMFLTLAWALLSAAWSPLPGYTVSQVVAITGVSMIAIAFSVVSWRPGRFEDVLTTTVTTVLVLSLVYAVVFPAWGVHSESDFSLAGSWRGITYQKNSLGQVATVGLILWTYRMLTRRNSWQACLLGIALSVFMVVKSRSNTALVAATLSCMMMFAILRPALLLSGAARQLIFVSLALVIPVVGFLAVATDLLQPIGEFFGKGGTFTGRADIWREVFVEIAKHPIMGIGFSAFWGGEYSLAGNIIRKLGWAVPGAHNGYLDIINELGLIGITFFAIFLALHARALGQLSRFDRPRFALLAGLFLYLVLVDFSESGWFRPITQTHLIGMYCSIEVSRLLLQRRFALASHREAQRP
ncbi:MAG: lipid core--O-antigen ligase [Panacagrimonas sp.]|nr:O-antigen ligase family protein [Panacagrimonas sp.]MCC2656284.1 lipid core--O-antigen ligase [Panacagrimonas sp.]